MNRVGICVSWCLVSLGSLLSQAPSLNGADNQQGTKIRIGTYDNRAIAIAYAASRYQTDLMREKMAARNKAKAENDQAKVKTLEAWGGQFQRQLHLQGFGRAPVDDLLEPVKKQLAKVISDKQLAAITMSCDFTSEQVELIDVTDDLVKLYDPSPKTLQAVREIRKTEPITLTELKDNP